MLVVPRNGKRTALCQPIRPVDLRGLNLIGFKSSGSTQRVIEQLRADGIETHFVLRSDDNNVDPRLRRRRFRRGADTAARR